MTASPAAPSSSRTAAPGRLVWPVNALLASVLTLLWAIGFIGPALGPTALVGTVFLLLTLLPGNLRSFPRWRHGARVRALARRRRGFGISAGVWFVAHSVMAIQLLVEDERAVVTAPAMTTGILATAVFLALLATSSHGAQQTLGRRWKPLHRLVWFAVPLALAHTVLSNLAFEGGVNPLYVLLLGAPLILAGAELVRARRAGRGATHVALASAGTLCAVALVALT